jgi:hypothetical protein
MLANTTRPGEEELLYPLYMATPGACRCLIEHPFDTEQFHTATTEEQDEEEDFDPSPVSHTEEEEESQSHEEKRYEDMLIARFVKLMDILMEGGPK